MNPETEVVESLEKASSVPVPVGTVPRPGSPLSRSALLERALVALIIGLLFVPLVASLVEQGAVLEASVRGKVRKKAKVVVPHQPWKGIETFKKDLTDRLNVDFFGRDFLIRWTSETWFRIFHTCAAKSANITVGNNDWLFENNYLQEYCLYRVTTNDLEPLVKDLQRMQEVCDRLNIAFALLVTPSKAAICPEAIPSEWMQRYDPRPRAYDLFIPLLKQHGVRFIDGHALTLQAKANAPAPVFPKGGIHWGQYAALLTTNALIAELDAQGKSVAPIACRPVPVEVKSVIEERDLLRLMHLAIPWRYPIAKMEITPQWLGKSKRPNMAVIGGSFMWRIIHQLNATEQFSEIDGYCYYRLYKICNFDMDKGPTGLVREPTGDVDFAREIYGADCLVLEVNEAVIPGANHLKTFLREALDHVPANDERKPFLYESFQPYRWGESLSFRASDAASWKKPSLIGFVPFGKHSTWMQGLTASLRLSVPPTSRDLLLKAQVKAPISLPNLPQQNLRILANGIPAGEWRFTDDKSTSREVTIRKECLGENGQLVLGFEVIRPESPTNKETSRKSPDLGLSFESLVITEADR